MTITNQGLKKGESMPGYMRAATVAAGFVRALVEQEGKLRSALGTFLDNGANLGRSSAVSRFYASLRDYRSSFRNKASLMSEALGVRTIEGVHDLTVGVEQHAEMALGSLDRLEILPSVGERALLKQGDPGKVSLLVAVRRDAGEIFLQTLRLTPGKIRTHMRPDVVEALLAGRPSRIDLVDDALLTGSRIAHRRGMIKSPALVEIPIPSDAVAAGIRVFGGLKKVQRPADPVVDSARSRFLSKLQSRYPENFNPSDINLVEGVVNFDDDFLNMTQGRGKAPPTGYMKLYYKGQLIARSWHSSVDHCLRFDIYVGAHFKKLGIYEFLLEAVLQKTDVVQSVPTLMTDNSDNVTVFTEPLGGIRATYELLSEESLFGMRPSDRAEIRARLISEALKIPTTRVRQRLGFGNLTKILIISGPRPLDSCDEPIFGLEFKKGTAAEEPASIEVVVASFPKDDLRTDLQGHLTITVKTPSAHFKKLGPQGELVDATEADCSLGGYESLAVPSRENTSVDPTDLPPDFGTWNFLQQVEDQAGQGHVVDIHKLEEFFHDKFGERWVDLAKNPGLLRHARSLYFFSIIHKDSLTDPETEIGYWEWVVSEGMKERPDFCP